jgi:hypothetical protein
MKEKQEERFSEFTSNTQRRYGKEEGSDRQEKGTNNMRSSSS